MGEHQNFVKENSDESSRGDSFGRVENLRDSLESIFLNSEIPNSGIEILIPKTTDTQSGLWVRRREGGGKRLN
jgi:hypothetical protein